MRTRLLALLFLLLVLATGAYYLVSIMPYDQELSRQKRLHRYWEREFSRLTAEDVHPALVAHLDKDKYPNETARIDAVRSLVHAFSIREFDDTIAKQGDTVTTMFARLLEDPDAEKPKLKCDHQANVMIAILDSLGIQARLVHVFSSRGVPDLDDHSFLEVLNPDSGNWEIQDPYYDIYWKKLDGAEAVRRACLLELVMDNPAGFAPCRGEVCDWSMDRLNRKFENAFQAMVWDFSRNKKRSVCIINSRRFELNAVFDEPRIKQERFEDFLERWISPTVIVQ